MSNRIVLPFINILEVIIFNCLGLHKDNPEEICTSLMIEAYSVITPKEK